MKFRFTRVLQFNFEDEEGYGVDTITGKDIVKIAVEAGANTIAFFARDAWGRAFYNSKIARKISKLGERDLLKEIVEEASKHGIYVIPMIGHTTNPELFSKHPDWAQRHLNGEIITMDTDPSSLPRENFTWPLMCLNSPFLDHVLKEVEEVLRYGVSGIFLDSFRYMPDVDRACFCEWCRKKFSEENGFELPGEEDLRSEAYRKSFMWRLNVNIRSLKVISEKLRKINSGAILVYNNHPLAWRGRANSISELSRDFVDVFFAECSETDFQPPGFIAEMVKLTRAITGKPVWATRNSFHMALTPRQTTDIAIRQGLREAFAGGGWPIYLMFASTFMNKQDLMHVKRVYEEIGRLEEYMFDAEPLPYVGIVFSNRSRDWSGEKMSPHITDSFRGFYYALLLEGFPVNYISDTCLDEGKFREYKSIILANTWSISTSGIKYIKKYYSKNGGMIATYKAGILDEHGKELEETRLEEVLGLKYRSLIRSNWSYIRVVKNHPVTDSIEGKFILWGDFDREFVTRRTPPEIGWHVYAINDHADVLGYVTLTNRDFGNEYENGRSPPPPVINTSIPGITVGDKWVYFSGQPGRIFWRTGSPQIRKLIINSIRYVAGPPPVKVKSYGFTELEAYRRNGQILIHLLNHTYPDRIIVRGNTAINTMWTSTSESVHPPTKITPLTDTKIYVRDFEISKVYEPLSNRTYEYRQRRNIVEIDIPRLDEYMFLVLDLR